MAATPGSRVGVLRFDQSQADQSPVLIHSLDRVAVQLQLADHGRWAVKPSRAQRGKRHRLLTSMMQLLKRQTMLGLNERHRSELSTRRPRRSRLLAPRPFLRQRHRARAIAHILEREHNLDRIDIVALPRVKATLNRRWHHDACYEYRSPHRLPAPVSIKLPQNTQICRSIQHNEHYRAFMTRRPALSRFRSTAAAPSERATGRERSGAAGDDGGTALAAERAAERREGFSDDVDCAPISVGIPEAKVQADRASVEAEHRAGLDAVLEVRRRPPDR